MPKKGFIKINKELCKGCCLCQSVCPLNLIVASDTLNQTGYYPARYIEENVNFQEHMCKGCALCAVICPEIAIEVYCE